MSALPGSKPAMSITVDGKDDKLLVLRMEGKEQLGALPEWRLELVANVGLLGARTSIDVHTELLGKPATVTIAHGADRYFNAYIAEVQRGERHGRFDAYRVTLRPWLWFATLNRTSRIFQGQTLKAIVTQVLEPYKGKIDWRASKSGLDPLKEAQVTFDHCVQYQESDFDFISRLLEAQGLHYFFEHTKSAHELVITVKGHSAKAGDADIKWAHRFNSKTASMTDWHMAEEVHAIRAQVRDFNYLASASTLEAKDAVAGPDANALLGTGEVYEYPAGAVYNQLAGDAPKDAPQVDTIAKLRLEELQSLQKVYTGTTNANDLAIGTTFDLKDSPHPEDEGSYLVVSMSFSAEFADHEAIGDIAAIRGRRDGFVASVMCIRTKGSPYRPQRRTPRPMMYGPQTAMVVGDSGNEVQTDKQGRVKVRFHWDRDTDKTGKTACFVRVSQPWAGKGMGLWMLPRVGHEVVVSFIGGDPDRPLITGSVHNDVNTRTYPLPANADISGWRTHSTKGGADDARHELRFDDKTDKEYVWLQSQKDFRRHVKADAFDWIEQNENKKVKLTRKEVVGENWYVNVGKDVMHDLGKDLHTKVAGDIFTTGAATWQLKLEKDYSAKIGADYGLDVTGKTAVKAGGDLNLQSGGAGNFKTTGNLVAEAGAKLSLKAAADVLMEGLNIKAKGSAEIVLEATAGIKLVCGAAVITLGPAGITIDGPLVKVNCGGGGGSAGSAESAAAAEPKAPEEAKVHEPVTPAKAEDYDKLFADPLTDEDDGPATRKRSNAFAEVKKPDVSNLRAGVLAVGANLLAAGGAAALALAGGAIDFNDGAKDEDPAPADDGEAQRQKALDESANAVKHAETQEREADAIRDHRDARQTLAEAQAAYDAAKAAEAAAETDTERQTAAAALAVAEAAYEAAKQAEAAAQAPTQTADEALAAAEAAYNAAKQAEAQAAAEAAAAAEASPAPETPPGDGAAV